MSNCAKQRCSYWRLRSPFLKTLCLAVMVCFLFTVPAVSSPESPLKLDVDAGTGTTGDGYYIFMFNNDSDQNNGQPDHADQIINGKDDLEDLTRIVIQIPGGKTGKFTVSVSEPAVANVNLFYKDGDRYIFVKENRKLELPVQPVGGTEYSLFVEAASYAGPGWDGTATITAILETIEKTYKKSVRLKVAPFILLSAVQRAHRIYVREFPGKNESFISALKSIVSKLGVQLRVIPAGTYQAENIWLQDVMEVGYSSSPFKTQHVVLRANRGKSLDDMPQQMILSPSHGWFRIGRFNEATGRGWGSDSWLDWYGNLEVTPPLPGKSFGRIIYGFNKYTGKSMNPQIIKMLEAQGVQTPLIKIHTGWLLIKHVDEIFNFIRTPKGKGYKVMVPDIRVTYQLLDRWISEGKGELTVLRGLKQKTALSLLANDENLRKYNLRLQKEEIEISIGMMKGAIGIDETDIIRLPALYYRSWGAAASMMPNMVNSIHMNGHQIISDPRGPVENGRDLIQDYVTALLEKENLTVHFIDDLPYHVWHGNAHCATNVTYQPYDTPWWK